HRLIEIVLRFEDELLRRAVLPGGRAQVAERDLALAVVELGDLAELQRVAFAGAAGEIVKDPPARRHGRVAARLRERELVDRAMGCELNRGRQRPGTLRGEASGQRYGGQHGYAEHRSTERCHRHCLRAAAPACTAT